MSDDKKNKKGKETNLARQIPKPSNQLKPKTVEKKDSKKKDK